MIFLIDKLNGLIRLKVDGLRKSCEYLNIEFKEANYNIKEYDPYLAGLVDTDGSIVYNYVGNRIECNLEFKNTEFSRKLNLDNVIRKVPDFPKPGILFMSPKLNINDGYQSSTFTYLYWSSTVKCSYSDAIPNGRFTLIWSSPISPFNSPFKVPTVFVLSGFS